MATYQTEPRYGIRYPAPGAALPDYETYLKSLATDVGTKTAGYSSGLQDAMPVAGIEGRFYRQTDTGTLLFDNGSAWTVINQPLVWQTIYGQSGWTNLGNGYETAAFTIDGFGLVHLKGVITGGSSGALAFTLPPGFRPGGITDFAVAGQEVSVAQMQVNPNGETFIYGSSIANVGLDSPPFLAQN